MFAFRTPILGLAAVVAVAFPVSAGSRTSDAAPTTDYSLSALALLGPDGTEVHLSVTSATAPVPDLLEKVQVKVWPLDQGAVETRNFFDVWAPAGAASLHIGKLSRLQRVQVRAHVKERSQNVLSAETLVQYRALGAVSTDHRLATEAGKQILKAGGNAFDAAAAVLFALNVTQPQLAGIGGSSNIVVYVAAEGRHYAFDARERAPAATTSSMFVGQTIGTISINGYSVGVPGTLRAVERMLDEWGTMSLADTLQPAIGYAEKGFEVGSFLAREAADPRVRTFQPQTTALFLPGGSPVKQGDLLVQPDLAKTFRLIAREGTSVFYRGEIASAIVAAQKWQTVAGGEGRMTLDDLAAYDVVVRSPSHLDYKGYDVQAAAPSSSGGLVLLEALGLLEDERFPIGDAARGYGFGSRYTIHAMVEALRLALADRDAWVGDPAFFAVPESQLLSDAYLRDRSGLMNPFPTRMPALAPPGDPVAFPASMSSAELDEADAGHTTHFSIIDKYGNVVSFTTTLADAFGSGITVPGYGFLLNDSMRLFNLTPRGGPNDAAPGKRPAGSMTPVVVMKDGEPLAATGTWGSTFIPSLVLNFVLDLVDHDLSLQQAVDASRLWITQTNGLWAWNGGRREAPSFSLEEIDALRALGPPRPVRVPSARDEVFGSLASVGVDLDTFALQSAADDARLQEATAEVVERDD